jgi:pilus assembly protein CpaB
LEYGTTLTYDNVSEVPWESSIVPEGAFKLKADLLKDGTRAALTSIILTTSDSKDKPSRSHADVLLQGVKVLATGQIANDREDHPTVVPTVTVEVLAERVGTLSLVLLRQAGDADPEAVRRIG